MERMPASRAASTMRATSRGVAPSGIPVGTVPRVMRVD